MNEAETRAELIDPKLKDAGWGSVEASRIGREVHITLGRLEGAGKRAKPDIADYVLVYRNTKLAVIEAKRRDLRDTEGVGQAKKYADKIQARFAFSTNGIGIYRIDMQTGEEGYLTYWPSPDELWQITYPQTNTWRDRFASIPFVEPGSWAVRYYQENAVNNVLTRVSEGSRRVLLTLATGTGKTSIAFQIAWKLFKAKWNLGNEPTRSPRILFLADRNTLADQAFNDFTSFASFDDSGLIRISPDEILRKGRAPKNGAVFFTIFQTFMTGRNADGAPAPNYGDYPPDFFDCIIIDECHRGGAKDESSWRGILEYFSPALQIGLTATPKRTINADTYAYFGDPVYIYSLKEGIRDGYLTPFKVKQIATTLDTYVYTPDDEILEGEVEEGRQYTQADFNRIIEIRQREEHRVRVFMEMIDQGQKTLVFCATQDHALAVRDAINQLKKSADPHYCERVTANDGKLGDQHLREFRDNQKTIPTILTTSQKLSTGVDARNVRNIVLLRPVNSIIEFKQIIGRGTRLYDGKDYFTIYDFVRAHEHFNDPDWDGEPLPPDVPNPTPPRGDDGGDTPPQPPEPGDDGDEGGNTSRKLKIKLADGKERNIQHMVATTFMSGDGTLLSAAQFIESLFGELPSLFKNEDELRQLWGNPETRKKLLERLSEQGFGPDQLAEIRSIISAEQSDLFDVLAYVAYALPTKTRVERAEMGKQKISAEYDGKLQAFLDFVLGEYVKQGDEELNQDKLGKLVELKYGTTRDAADQIGSVGAIRDAFLGFQKHLYER
jgi:type I restriction enzyme R subunit